ncbi:OLC1v1036372C1 [Oldenlandia corymbosa var. corymbosa]|uniref:OLC1v1036372C1 n=1 Tax=Oldenlandia corymbosa var. corymbosa TaxID=529605 RepID=A0AAV1CVP0_OLDCO|nr:OLC1v1036372C1 [Oldenlandia corymbosa var. corymbosa]
MEDTSQNRIEKQQIWNFEPFSASTDGDIEIGPASRLRPLCSDQSSSSSFPRAKVMSSADYRTADANRKASAVKQASAEAEFVGAAGAAAEEAGTDGKEADLEGCDIINPPDNSYKATLKPYKFENDDDGTIKPEILDKADKCIQLYNETHGQQYRVLHVLNVTVTPPTSHSLYKITFLASPVDTPVGDQRKAKKFLGKYLVDLCQGDEDDSGATFCKTKDEATKGFDVDLPCSLPCWSRYHMYKSNSLTYRQYTRQRLKEHMGASSWEHGAPAWVQEELTEMESQLELAKDGGPSWFAWRVVL